MKTMKKIIKFSAIIASCLMALGLASCSREVLDTDQFSSTEVTLNAYGPLPVARGGVLRFVGSNLDQVTAVNIPGVGALTDITVVKSGVPSEITVTLPKDGPEPGTVSITTKDGKTINAVTPICYTEPISIESVTPATVYPGDELTITGDYLNLMHEVIFEKDVFVSENDFVSHDRYKIVVKVPAEARTGAVGVGDVDEINLPEDTKVVANQIFFEEETVVGTAVGTLVKANVKAGETVTVKGSHFDLVTAVKIGNVAVEDYKVSASELTFTLPAEAGDEDVLMVMASGVEVSAGKLETVKPTELKAAPAPVKAGQTLSITGKDIDLVTGVELPNASWVEFQNGEAITFTMPAAAQEGDAILHMANGLSVTVAYTLVKPVVTGYSANPAAAGSDVTLNGSDLDLVTAVIFGGDITVEVKDPAADALTVAVPTAAESGAVRLVLANGTEVEAPELSIDKPAGAYIATFPEDLYAPGTMFIIDIENAEHLTGVQVDGVDVNYILNGSTLYFSIPADATRGSQLTLVSDNGSVTYTMNIDPGDFIVTPIWTGSFTCDNWNGNQDLAWGGYDWSTVKPGTLLRFEMEPTVAAGSWWCISLRHGDAWGALAGVPGQYDSPESPLDVELTQEILDDLIASNGLIITGTGFILKQVSLVEDLRYGTNIWTGSFTCDNWNGNQDLAWGGFDWSTASVGQTLFFHMTPTVEDGTWWCISLRHGDAWGALAGVPGQYDSPESPMGVKLTQEILDDLKASNGLVITGTGFILSKVSLK